VSGLAAHPSPPDRRIAVRARPTRQPLAVLAAALAVLAALAPHATSAAAATTPITVAQAVQTQNGSTATVRGYVVGQPTSTSTVVTSGFPNDYAMALADAPGETRTSAMVYVQVPSAFRSQWGLRSNPSLMGRRLDVTGALAAYFSHAGLKSATAFASAGSSEPPPGGGGPYDDTYYAAALGKTGNDLRNALHTIISSGTTRLSYDQVWDALKHTDEDPSNTGTVILVYSGRSLSKSSNGGGVDDWNREHVWAKSHGDFGTATGPGTDLHHLRPADVTVYSTRGNKDFDEGGSSVYQCAGCLSDADSFEPRAAVKGDVARMVFSMAVRYEGGDGFPDLEVDDVVGNGTAPYLGRLSVLLRWNAEDPPDAFEQHRNQVIYDDYQHNRNPFIDHPEWVQSVFG
jgi:endonuclease I